MANPNFLKIFLQRSIIAGTGLSGGGTLSGDVTLKAKLTDSTNTTDSETAASATAVKTAYNRGSAGVTAAGTAQSAAATAQSTANQALNAANGKAPGGYGLGAQNGRNVHDANDAREAGWWNPDNNQNALNFYERNHPLLVLARNVWGTVQIQFVSGKIAVRELFDSQWSAWRLADVGYAESAGTANGIGGHQWLDSFDTGGNPPWVLGLATDNSGKLRPIRPSALRVSYAETGGTVRTAQETVVVPNVAFIGNGGKMPNLGGTWLYVYIPYDHHYLKDAYLAGGAAAPSNEGGIAIRYM